MIILQKYVNKQIFDLEGCLVKNTQYHIFGISLKNYLKWKYTYI